MNVCSWCGDTHGPTQLCQRAQRSLTRRSFCFLFGAGFVAALTPSLPCGIIPTEFVGRILLDGRYIDVYDVSPNGEYLQVWRTDTVRLLSGR